jgi:hypothetical protein
VEGVSSVTVLELLEGSDKTGRSSNKRDDLFEPS